MKVPFGLITLTLCVMIAGCAPNVETKKFTVTGERIVIWSGTQTWDLDAPDESPVGLASEENEAWGQQEISVEIESNKGAETVTLASGTFTDDKIALEGEIEEWFTPISINVTRGNEEKMSLFATGIDSESHPTFALLDYESPASEDKLLFVGDARINEDDAAEFTISGDVSSITD